jgi:golgi to ER traffic protein 4
MYFGISVPRQSNPMMDMLGNMFMGGGSKAKKGNAPAPAALD